VRRGDRILTETFRATAMQSEPARALRAARQSGSPEFIETPTRVESTGLVIPPVRAETRRRCWQLDDEWSYDDGEWRMTLPRGWRTDLASVPPRLSEYFNSFEFGITGPLLHDFLYEHGGRLPEGSCVPDRRFTRREADALLHRLMRAERVPRWRRALAYTVARMAGWTHWEKPRAQGNACD
jgi:hypothetical protein